MLERPHGRQDHGPPEMCTSSSLETVAMLPYTGERDAAGVTKDFEVGRWSLVIQVAQWHHKGPYKREAGGSESERCGKIDAAGFEDGGRKDP